MIKLVLSSLAVGLACGALAVWLYLRPDDSWRDVLRELEAEAERLTQAVETAQGEANAARARLGQAEEEHAASRAAYDAREAERTRESARLRAEAERLRDELARVPHIDDYADADDSELALRASHVLAYFAPPATPPVVEARAESFVANRPAVEAALRAVERGDTAVALAETRLRQLRVAEESVADARREIEAGDALYSSCAEALGACERANETRAELAANAELRLEAQARVVAERERRIRRLVAERWLYRIGLVAAGTKAAGVW
jgi:response regulator RpfG family c-di-GMP phosphodiesterase